MYVTIHGHFYQPPRENPWTGQIQRQESAAPYSDWNARITDECYGPNGRSRVLDPDGRIVAIVNNFAHLSFNFGPTLLRDLEQRFPRVYRRVLEADRESLPRHGGHGNALAQAYNHAILPLADASDKRTQIRWGLRDFEHRFGRRSEGLWLPETAIDAETLRIAFEEGVRFLILAPRQAQRIRRLGEKKWEPAGDGMDTSRAYRCFVDASRRRWIDCFFYDGSLSVAVSFEHLLRDAGAFADRLQNAGRSRGANGLVHLATDGEVYGHHEPFADMCLAYLFTVEGPRRGMKFVNYPEYLDLFPPGHEVALEFSGNGEGTAWSCAHGIGRWARDCGCSTGGYSGWNQQWRAPLRQAFDEVRDRIREAYLSLAGRWLSDPSAARDDYVEVLLRPDEESRAAFLDRHLRSPADEETRHMLWSMLEASHQAMLMYTSCAWFFADVSGLEVQQNLGYAARACELAQPYVREPLEAILLRRLEEAKSNLPEWRHGSQVYRNVVQPRRVGPEHAAAQAALEAVALERALDRRVFGYEVRGRLDPGCRGPETECTGHLRVAVPALEQSWSWDFRVTPGSLSQRTVHLEPAVDPEASVAPSAADLRLVDFQREVREEISMAALRQSLEDESERIREIYEQSRPPLEVLVDLRLPLPEVHRHLAEHVLGRAFRGLAVEVHRNGDPPGEEWWHRIEELVLEMRRFGLRPELGPLVGALVERVEVLLDHALEEKRPRESLAAIRAAYGTLAAADRLDLPMNRTWIEPRVYELVLRFRAELKRWDDMPEEIRREDEERDLEALRALAGHANLQLDAILREGSTGAASAGRPL